VRRANPARQFEAEVTIGGKIVVLAGSFGNLARLQGALGVEGIGAVLRMLMLSDARAIIEGVKCLAVDAFDEKALADMDFLPAYSDIQNAIVKALTGVEPGKEPDAKNAESADGEKS